MADERTRPPHNQKSLIPATYAWPTLLAKSGENGRTTTEKDIIERDDFWATTSSNQLKFVRHIKTLLAAPRPAQVMT